MIGCGSTYLGEMAIRSFAVGREVVWKKAEDGESNRREESQGQSCDVLLPA